MVWDFDGVICDSAFEAFRLMFATSGHIDSPKAQELDYLYPEFLQYRSSVGPAWNYFFVAKALVQGEQLNWHFCSEAEAFELKFKAERLKFMKDDLSFWCGFHRFHLPVLNCLRRSRSDRNVVLTNKNIEPVSLLLNNVGLSTIKVHSVFGEKVTKRQFLAENLSKQTPFAFLDDHLATVIEVDDLKHQGFQVISKHASWGYAKETHQKFSLQLDGIFKWYRAL